MSNLLQRMKNWLSYDADREFYGKVFPASVDQFALKSLRKMKPDDLPVVLAIENVAYAFPWSEGVFRDCFKARYSCWVCETPVGTLLGYGIMSFAVGEAHILNLCVNPDHHNQGIGRTILTHLINVARQKKVENLFLEVRPSNLAAIALYQKMGFNEIGIRKDYYPAHDGREDALMLALTLVE